MLSFDPYYRIELHEIMDLLSQAEIYTLTSPADVVKPVSEPLESSILEDSMLCDVKVSRGEKFEY